MSKVHFKKVSDSETELTELMIPSYSNFGGKVHGGILLSLMDKIAYVCATKHAESYCVTVAVEGVEFLHPVEIGELVTLKSSVNFVGSTSMIVGIRIESLHPISRIVKHTNSCYFTMVAKDENNNLKQVPGLLIENDTQLRRFCEGKELRNFSKQKRDLLKSDLSNYTTEELIQQCEFDKVQIELQH